MKNISRLITNICSDNLEKSKYFYTKLFDFSIAFDSDWFIQLISKNNGLELGIIDRNNETVHNDYQKKPEGFFITFVVDNADDLYTIATKEGFEVLSKPTDTFYGQRRLLLKDPNGTLVDISSPIKDFQFN